MKTSAMVVEDSLEFIVSFLGTLIFRGTSVSQNVGNLFGRTVPLSGRTSSRIIKSRLGTKMKDLYVKIRHLSPNCVIIPFNFQGLLSSNPSV